MILDELNAPTLIAFATTSFLLNITPGPAVMQVVGHSMTNGWRAAQASILGILTGNAMYCALSVLGLGTLILAAPSLFGAIQRCGVTYLAWLGLKALRSAFSRQGALEAATLRARPMQLLRRSFILQGANPKSVLFFFTLLPVFAGEAGGAPTRIAVLGLVAIVMEYPALLGYALLASRTSRWFQGERERRWLTGLSGTAMLMAAGTVARASLRAR